MQKQRRRRALIATVVVVLIVALIVGTVVFFPRSSNPVPLPGYLDICVSGAGNFYHSHVSLTISINGSNTIIPASVGVGGCMRVIHTHAADGELHIEPDVDPQRLYTLHDFFLIWGNWENNANRAIFNQTQIFGNHVDGSHSLTVTLNGNVDTRYGDLPLPTGSGMETVVITYGPTSIA